MGATALRTIQIGKETTFGTSVAATAVLMGVTEYTGKPDYAIAQKRYLTGNYAPAHNNRVARKGGTIKVTSDFNFEDSPIWLNSAVKGGVGSSLTDTSAYTYTFPFPLTASPALESRTIEISDGTQEYEMPGGLVESFSLAGDASNDGLVTAEVNWMGTDFVKSTITGALTSRTVESLPAMNCKLYIDALGGTVGTTEKTTTLISWKFDYSAGVHLKKFGGGTLNPTSFGYGIPEVKLAVVAEFNATSIAEVDAYLAGTGRLYRIQGLGTLVGASTAYKTLRIDVAADITEVGDIWGDRDGNTTASFTLSARYDTGGFNQYGQITIINGIVTLPG